MVKAKTNKTKKSTTIKGPATAAVLPSTLNRDLLVSVLIVSGVVNLFVLTAWVTLQVTTMYDSQVASFLFTR